MSRTGLLLVLAAGAWAAGAVIATTSHWHPFSHGHHGSGYEIQALVPHRELIHERIERVHPTHERHRPPRGFSAAEVERALEARLGHELSERMAPHALHDPSSRAVMLSSQVISARPRAISDLDPMVLWPGVAARLEASGELPPHVHFPARALPRSPTKAAVVVAPARRGGH